MVSQIFSNVFPLVLIDEIKNFYSSESEVHTETGIINKNLEYHIPTSYIYQTLNPFLTAILGKDHEFSTGTYKSSQNPYIIHVDSRIQHDEFSHCMSFDRGEIKQNKAVLIPLVEGPQFRTVTFKVWSDYNPMLEDVKNKMTAEKNHLLPDDFDHDPFFDAINYLPVDVDYTWKKGDVLVWDRNQWHMSSNFWKQGQRKEFLVLFIA